MDPFRKTLQSPLDAFFSLLNIYTRIPEVVTNMVEYIKAYVMPPGFLHTL